MKSLSILLAAGVSTLVLASAAHAADLIIDTEPMMPGIVETSTSWDGPFIGVFGGYGWGSTDLEDTLDDFDAPEPEGWLLGVNAGVNFTLTDGIIAGVVGDIAWSNMEESVDFGLGSYSSNVDWLGSVRGRLGFDGGAFMPYLTAGLAFAHNEIEAFDGDLSASDDQTHVGWTVGAGVEFAATENLSIDLLYRYSDYGDATYTVGPIEGDVGLTSHTLTVGLNFGF